MHEIYSLEKIVHIQYTSWPDRSAPEEPGKLLQLIDLTRVLAEQYCFRPQNCTPSISSIKPAEKTLMSASTLNVADESVVNTPRVAGHENRKTINEYYEPRQKVIMLFIPG